MQHGKYGAKRKGGCGLNAVEISACSKNEWHLPEMDINP